jgi:hypothetical protein
MDVEIMTWEAMVTTHHRVQDATAGEHLEI